MQGTCRDSKLICKEWKEDWPGMQLLLPFLFLGQRKNKIAVKPGNHTEMMSAFHAVFGIKTSLVAAGWINRRYHCISVLV